jgi:cell division protein FtsX
MKKIDVKNQKRLSMKRCFDLVLSGVQFRLFRAAITVAIVALAVAFLMTMLTESLSAQRVATAIEDRVAPREMLLYWVDRVTNPLSPADLTEELASIEPGGPRWQEFAAWGTLTDEQLAQLQDVAQKQLPYRDFFTSLDEGEIRPLLGRVRGTAIYESLQDEEKWQHFAEELPRLNTQLPTSAQAFKDFLEQWKQTQPHRQAIIAGHIAAIDQADALMGEQSANAFFATDDPDTIRRLQQHGYVVPDASLHVIREQAALVRHARMIERTLMVSIIKNRLASDLNTDSADVTADMLFNYVRSSGGAQWLTEQVAYVRSRPEQLRNEIDNLAADIRKKSGRIEELETQAEQARSSEGDTDAEAIEKQLEQASNELADLQAKLDEKQTQLSRALGEAEAMAAFDVDVDRIQSVADYRREQDRLADIESTILESDVATDGEGWMGFSTRTLWLLIVSFVVCVVGIANAMLMSVTERFREIATMKCLGATDGFIMINFILESCMQGLAGGLVGTVLGLILGLLRTWAGYGTMALATFPWSSVLAIGGISLVMGVVLSAIAAVYPAWVAARLAPMEAMRIE